MGCIGFLAMTIAFCICENKDHYCQNYDWYKKSLTIQLDYIKIYQSYKIILVLFWVYIFSRSGSMNTY